MDARYLRVRLGVIVSAVLTLLICTTLGVTAQIPVPARGGTIVVALGGDPPLLNPHFSTLPWVYMSGMGVFNSLVRLDLALNPHPDLAESWSVSPDVKVYTFKLVRNAQWHDGRPFTSADVKFTIEEVLMKLNPNGPTIFSGLERVDTPDPYTAVLRFNRPHPAAFLYLDVPLTGVILPKHVFEGTDIRRNPANAAPIGTGPFRFVEWNRGERIVLERNARYFKKDLPYLDRVVFRVVRDPAARVVALQNRDVDMILGFDLPVRDSIPVRQSRDLKALFTVDRAISGQWFMGLNTSRPPFNDLKVRQAVAHAISKNLIWQRVFFGLGKVGTGPISQYLGQQYEKNVPKYDYDLQKANQLLDEAGLRRGAGGVRFRVRFTFDGSTAEWGRIGDILKEALAEVGIDVSLESLDFNTWFDRVYVKRDYDISSGRRVTGPDPITAMIREYHSRAIQPAARNYYFYNNQEVDRQLEQGAEETDAAKRLQITRQLQVTIMRDLPTIILMDVPQPNAFRSAFIGLDNAPWGAQRLEGVWTAK
jgi:peptide/nickel transport system substrate-binding protein